ncbi:hypothetical protein [Cyanobium sp. NIES-981]|uniref:hypothetical protein n=1 Tax=Cyanobium sp. NIES-981 TaxID=1851505 RepID=UPI0007DD2DB4|nr:hypothetical protein [Cyanobium sp. NIES-981]SBO44657.1 conserved exported protein of unknown function [Cyanobium sp. NIES-981]
MDCLGRRSLPWALLLLGPLLQSSPGNAQMLLDPTAAASMQGSVTSINVPGANATLNKVRENTAAVRSVDSADPSAPPPAPSSPAAGPQPAAPQPPAQTPARVNGRSVPYCSHGGLCHGALLRAMGIN